MTGAAPPAAGGLHALKAEFEEMRACFDSLISLVAGLGDVDDATGIPAADLPSLEARAKEIRLRLERAGEHLAEIYAAMRIPLPQPDPVGLAEVREILECITNDRLALALTELRALLARFPEEPD